MPPNVNHKPYQQLILTCEHGGNRVPPPYVRLFRGAEAVLASHRGYDLGALSMARTLARKLAAPLVAANVTRLLVELNRSLHHPALFSDMSRRLDRAQKHALLARYYHPHRRRVEQSISAAIHAGRTVLHVGVHSFTPILRGQERNADVGLLYDPKRRRERDFCQRWRDALRHHAPELRVRMNYPYRGQADGLTTALRHRFSPQHYLGIELEVNQKWVHAGRFPGRMAAALATSLAAAMN